VLFPMVILSLQYPVELKVFNHKKWDLFCCLEQISSNADKILNAGEIFHPNSEEEQGEQSLVVLYFNVTVTHIQRATSWTFVFVFLGNHSEHQRMFPCQPCPRQRFKVLEAPLQGKLRFVCKWNF
jgi:hypothetical protein